MCLLSYFDVAVKYAYVSPIAVTSGHLIRFIKNHIQMPATISIKHSNLYELK